VRLYKPTGVRHGLKHPRSQDHITERNSMAASLKQIGLERKCGDMCRRKRKAAGAGWSSNNKYSLLGGLRASAQMVSYEIALGLSLVGVLIQSGTFSLRGIVDAQGGMFLGIIPRWNIFHGQFIGFFIYLMAAYAETNRIPFDLPEAETELVAGYHTEYSAMKFAMFFMAEYANMITVACVATLLFFGGWQGPVFGPEILQVLLPVFWFVAKIFCFLFLYIWVRGTLPRFRYDQLMDFGWKFLLPLAIANLVATAIAVAW
jgi:NADH-quinone oxidoreductase subunit H